MPINTNRWNRIRYTAIAPLYDLVTGFASQRRRSISLLALRPGQRVLIVGCGTGADLPYLPPGVEIVAGDITPAMVERTRRRAEALRLPARVEVMDGQALPLPPASVDAVILHLIVAVIPAPVACLRETARVLRPGGAVVVFDKFAPDHREPSLPRRLLNLVANAVATDVTRRLGPLLQGTGLRVAHREPAALGGFFEIALLTRG